MQGERSPEGGQGRPGRVAEARKLFREDANSKDGREIGLVELDGPGLR